MPRQIKHINLILFIFVVFNLSLAISQTYLRPPALIEGLTATTKAAGTTTLTAASQTQQTFNGTSAQTVVLPDATTLDIGRKFYINNMGTAGSITVRDATPATIYTVPANSSKIFVLQAKATAAGTWDIFGRSSGSEIDGFTAGSVIFAGSTGFLDQDNSNFFWDDTNNRLGIGTTTPSTSLAFGGAASRTMAVERSTSTSGSDLTVRAGGALSGGTDLAGGTLNLTGGQSTGTGASSIAFRTYTAAAASGSADNSVSTKMTLTEKGFFGIGVGPPAAQLNLGGNFSAPAWTSAGIGLAINASTFTDTTSTGSPSIVVHSIGTPTISSTNAITPTLTTFRISGPPTDGTNVVSGSKFALIVASGNTRYAGLNLFGTNSGSPTAALQVDGNRSDTSWGTSGKSFSVLNATLTDTSGSGTIAARVGSSFNNTIFASSSATTLTQASNLYISGAASAGSNTTITNSNALTIASLATSGTPTNTYGLNLSASSGGTNNYAATITGNVGMGGVTDPLAPLSIAAQSDVANSGEQLELRSQRNPVVAGELIGGVSYRSNDTSHTAPGVIVALESAVAEITHTGSVLDTGFAFYTTKNLTMSEKVRIDADGDVGIGITSSITAKLQVDGTADQVQASVQGFSTQTSNIFETESSAGTDYFKVEGDGQIVIGSGAASAGSILDIQSTTQAIRLPKIATASLPSGLDGFLAFDDTTDGLVFYDGTAYREIYSGNYTSTCTGITNVAGVTFRKALYHIIGKVVKVMIITENTHTTAANTVTEMRCTLPVASNLGNFYELAGSASTNQGTPYNSGFVEGSTSADAARVFYNAATTGTTEVIAIFSYEVI